MEKVSGLEGLLYKRFSRPKLLDTGSRLLLLKTLAQSGEIGDLLLSKESVVIMERRDLYNFQLGSSKCPALLLTLCADVQEHCMVFLQGDKGCLPAPLILEQEGGAFHTAQCRNISR